MQGLSSALVKKIDLSAAIAEEALSVRNLVPPEPGWDRIARNPQELVGWISSSLRSGFNPGSQYVSKVRKTPGVRPVAHWGPIERILYRALTKAVLGDRFNIDRSPEKYVEFIKAPVEYSYELQRERNGEPQTPLQFFFLQSDLKYIARSDIAAFYQYVDHAILAAELRVTGADYDLVTALMELLSEAQGRTYGLPQLLDASDALSEVYIDTVERTLLRQGFPTWRFNDDFRIGCESYNDALRSIEALDAAARDVGLVLNENKTLTYGFMTYMVNSFNVTITDEQNSVLLDEVEVQVGDYTDDFSDDVDAARTLVQSTASPRFTEGGIDLQRVTTEDVRLLRRALSALANANDASVAADIQRLFAFVPELTPSILGYLREVHPTDPAAVETSIDAIIENTSLNEWQRMWVVDILRRIDLIKDQSAPADARAAWVEAVRTDSESIVTRSVASLALAQAEKRSFRDIVRDYEQSSAPTLVWALEAVREAQIADPTGDNQKSTTAIAGTSPLHKALLA